MENNSLVFLPLSIEFHQWGSEPRNSSPSKAVENQDILKTCKLVGQFLNLVQDMVNLASGVVPLDVIVGSIFLAGDEVHNVE